MRSWLVILVFMLAGTGGAAGQGTDIPDDKQVISFDTKLGVVTFNHQKHSDLSSTECTTCHHAWKPGEVVKPCHACHGKKDAESPAAKSAFHDRCIGCHQYTVDKGETAGPLKKKCKLCHIK